MDKSNFYYFDGDDRHTIVNCAIDGHLTQFQVQLPIEKAAQSWGINTYTWPDGRGFAINFDNVAVIGKIAVAMTGEGPQFHINEKCVEIVSAEHTPVTLENIAPMD